ncbi:MAG: hypothetical protein V4707_05355 [Pseudomonadota bacterium]
MRATVSAAAIAAITALLGGCSVNLGFPPAKEEPVVVWSGYLEEIDGSPAQNSGIRLEIIHTFSKTDPAPYTYALDTGCVGGGFLKRSGELTAFETLRPCVVEDVERMMLLNRMSFAGNSGTPDGDAILRWAGTEATLTSPLGQARFTNANAKGTSE